MVKLILGQRQSLGLSFDRQNKFSTNPTQVTAAVVYHSYVVILLLNVTSIITLVNVYVDLMVFTRIAGTS